MSKSVVCLVGIAAFALQAFNCSAQEVGNEREGVSYVFASPAPETLERIRAGCLRNEEPVAQRDDDSITCEVPLGRGERIAARFLLREPFAGSPRAFVKFRVVQDSPAESEVHASGWLEDGRVTRGGRSVSLRGARFAREMRSFLGSL